MEPKFQVQLKIRKPVVEVFDAVVEARETERLFRPDRRADHSAEGATVKWKFAEVPERVRCRGPPGGQGRAHRLRVAGGDGRLQHAGRDGFQAARRREHHGADQRIRLARGPGGDQGVVRQRRRLDAHDVPA